MGVLAGFVLLIARAIGGSRRWHGLMVIGFVLLYLLLVEAQVAVLRAGVMSMIASLGLVFGRRYTIGGLVSVSAIAILIWRPDQIFNAGFQLTFGVVLGLIHLSPVFRRRWFGRPDMEAPTVGAMLLQWFYTVLAASVTAWLIALPIVLHHFGLISPLSVAMSIITLPLAAIILSIGFLKQVRRRRRALGRGRAAEHDRRRRVRAPRSRGREQRRHVRRERLLRLQPGRRRRAWVSGRRRHAWRGGVGCRVDRRRRMGCTRRASGRRRHARRAWRWRRRRRSLPMPRHRSRGRGRRRR
jgi:ComEC/Rec2-related protein